MAQIKIYGRRDHLHGCRGQISDAIHACLMAQIGLPAEKRFHRFIALDGEDFIYPVDRSQRYTIIEISMFEGRSAAAKKSLIRALFAELESACGIAPHDVEITIFETPRANWGIRGQPGDELGLTYKVEV